MSTEKQAQLIADGKLAEDGTRIPHCPLCGQAWPEGVPYPEAAVVETVEASASTDTEEATE